MTKIAHKDNIKTEKITIDLPNFGLGIMRTSTAYVALIIQLEGNRHSQIAVLGSVMEHLGIHPEEILHRRKQPDFNQEAAFMQWDFERKEIEKKLGVKKDK